jgi:hypothetical protein
MSEDVNAHGHKTHAIEPRTIIGREHTSLLRPSDKIENPSTRCRGSKKDGEKYELRPLNVPEKLICMGGTKFRRLVEHRETVRKSLGEFGGLDGKELLVLIAREGFTLPKAIQRC